MQLQTANIDEPKIIESIRRVLYMILAFIIGCYGAMIFGPLGQHTKEAFLVDTVLHSAGLFIIGLCFGYFNCKDIWIAGILSVGYVFGGAMGVGFRLMDLFFKTEHKFEFSWLVIFLLLSTLPICLSLLGSYFGSKIFIYRFNKKSQVSIEK